MFFDQTDRENYELTQAKAAEEAKYCSRYLKFQSKSNARLNAIRKQQEIDCQIQAESEPITKRLTVPEPVEEESAIKKRRQKDLVQTDEYEELFKKFYGK